MNPPSVLRAATRADAASPAGGGGSVQVTAAQMLLFAIWCALLAGVLETAILAAQQHIFQRIIYRSSHYLWMSPVGALIVFTIAALAWWLMSRGWRRLAERRVFYLAFTALALLSVITVPRALHFAAAALLALGGAAAASRALLNPPARLPRLMRRSLPILALLVFALFGTAMLTPRLYEGRTLQPANAARAAPNVLFIILDTVRAKSLSLYGHQRPTTPNLDSFARSGVVFERAIAPAPWTLPSHGSMFTGQPAHALSTGRFTPLDDRLPTLAEVLTRRGYATAGFVANLAYASREFGLARGFARWEDYPVGLAQILSNTSLGRAVLLEDYSGGRNSWLMRVLGIEHWIGHTKNAAHVNAEMLRWVADQRDRPFFAFINYFDAHMPYLPPPPYFAKFGRPRASTLGMRLRTERPGRWQKRGDAAAEQALLDRYEEAIAYVDAQLGDLIEELRAEGKLDNTLIVISSDHGEEFGEHGQYEHDTNVYFTQVHVPLVVVQAGRVPAGVRIQEPVELQDIAATILELTNSPRDAVAGRSLTAKWERASPETSPPALATLKRGNRSQASLVTSQHHYLRFADGSERIYDHVADVAEQFDLSTTHTGRAVIERLRPQLRTRLGGAMPVLFR